jgi:hypothetical protein
MSPQERHSLMFLEPELRQARRAGGGARRVLSGRLQRALLLLRAYVVATVAVIIVALVRGVH